MKRYQTINLPKVTTMQTILRTLHHQDHLRQENNHHHYPPNPPFVPNSPLSTTLQQTPWPIGYKPTQLPKYNGSVDPTLFLMSYKATICSAGRDDPIMGKSFVMACEGPVTSWYSYFQPLSVASWHNLKEKLRQDFQVFKKMDVTSMEDFQCIQMDREPLPEYLQKFV